MDGRHPAAPATEEAVHEAALRLLAARARSRSELDQRLRAKGHEPAVVERVLERLATVGLLDDAAFARSWVHQRHTYSGKGRRALAQELRHKGVADEDAGAALDQVDDAAEAERARELVLRRLRTVAVPADPTDRAPVVRRLVGVLARRGYAPGLAFAVVRDALAEVGADTADLDPSV